MAAVKFTTTRFSKNLWTYSTKSLSLTALTSCFTELQSLCGSLFAGAVHTLVMCCQSIIQMAAAINPSYPKRSAASRRLQPNRQDLKQDLSS